MSGIYIPGMEMPLEGEYHMTLYVCSDGNAYIDVESFPVDADRFEAIPVPEHGRLVDADAFMQPRWIDSRNEFDAGVLWTIKKLGEAPTVIPEDKAEECET